MPQVIVLDTHIWFWFITAEFQRFPSPWREHIETTGRVGVSAVSCFEIALAHRRGRLMLPIPAAAWLEQALQPSGIELLPLTPAIASRAANLTEIHRDPFDRLIIATALECDAQLASIDSHFRAYPELADRLMT